MYLKNFDAKSLQNVSLTIYETTINFLRFHAYFKYYFLKTELTEGVLSEFYGQDVLYIIYDFILF